YVMSGTESPSRWYELTPGMLDRADESQLIADAEPQHVEYVIVTNRATFEYGYPFFGIDWGKDIYRWINTNFEQSGEFGKFERSIDAPFSALIYKRRTIPDANPAKSLESVTRPVLEAARFESLAAPTQPTDTYVHLS